MPLSTAPSPREPPWSGPSATSMVGAWDESSIPSDTIGKSASPCRRLLSLSRSEEAQVPTQSEDLRHKPAEHERSSATTVVRSEFQLQRELHVPHRAGYVEDLARCPRIDSRVRQGKIRIIERIEVLPSELEFVPFGQGEVFGERKIGAEQFRPPQRVARRISEQESTGSRIDGRVEPLVTILRDAAQGIAGYVRTQRHVRVERSVIIQSR